MGPDPGGDLLAHGRRQDRGVELSVTDGPGGLGRATGSSPVLAHGDPQFADLPRSEPRGVLTAAYAMAIIVGTVVAIGQTRKLTWLSRITWQAATLSLALPLASTFAGLNPPWAAWCGFAVIYVLMHGCAASWAA